MILDDVVQRLAPSLAPYIGGTVIDYHPGVSLFSSRLHDFLKPRNHILIEPHYKTYAPFINPLLDAPDSRYRHRDWEDERIWLPKPYVEEGLIPNSTTDLNSATLFIVNATGKQLRIADVEKYRIADSEALKFALASRHNNAFHARGPTRMLIWCDDDVKNSILPRTVDWRRKLAMLLEAHCHVEEVVGFGAPAKGAQRERNLIKESSMLVRARMQQTNTYTPPKREIKSLEGVDEYSDVSRYWHEELHDLEARFNASTLSQYVGLPPGPLKHQKIPGVRKAVDKREKTPEYQRLLYLQNILIGQNAALSQVQGYVDEQAAIDAFDLRSYSASLDESEKQNILREIDDRTKTLKDSLSRLSMNKQKQFKYLSDDRHALHMAPGPLLMWDQRSYEPLAASSTEFYYPRKLALLDLQSKPPGTLPLNNQQSLYFDLLASALFGGKGSHDLGTLKTVAPGAYEDLVPRVEELRDARKGGRRDVESLRSRTLTPEMLWRLTMEWDQWTFKPGFRELVGFAKGSEAAEVSRRHPT